MSDLADRWLLAMARGIETRADLLSVVLLRMSPEYVVVASAVEGLVRDIGEEPFDVAMEAPFHDKRLGRGDIVVLPRNDEERFYFEFKTLWPKAIGENTSGIRWDLTKLAALPRSYVVVFSFALSAAPRGCEGRCSKESAGAAVEQVTARLDRGPCFKGNVFSVKGNGVIANARVLAWKA